MGADVTCDITVPIGQSVSFYAYEGFDGVVNQGSGFTLEGRMYEFVAFSGECSQPGQGFNFGDCVTTPAQARTYVVNADFTIMPTFAVFARGMTSATGPITARNVLGLPVRPNIITSGGVGGPSATEVKIAGGAFAFGTEIKLIAADSVNRAKFIRWEGCLTGTGGTNKSCTLPQGTSGGAPGTVRLFFEYWQCPLGQIADAPGPNCTLVRP